MRVLAIAGNTFREAVRDRVLYNLILFALLLIGAAVLFGTISVGIESTIMVTLGLSSISVFGLFMAIFIGIGLVSKEIDRKTLPADWRSTPAPATLQEIGAKWIDNGSTSVLKVPSAVISGENNYLLNPAHSEFGRISVVGQRDFRFDSRT